MRVSNAVRPLRRPWPVTFAAAAGSRQTIALKGVRKPKRGVYNITVLASPVNTMFVGDVLRASVRVH